MRHRKKGRRLNRNTNQRKALFKSLISGLILNEEIKTTEAKAKAIRGLFDKLMTKAKQGSVSARRQVLSFLPDKKIVNKLFDELAPRTKKRTSGFSRFVRIGRRRGDQAMIVKMELVDKPAPSPAKPAQKKTTAKNQKKSKSVKTDQTPDVTPTDEQQPAPVKKGFFKGKIKQIIPQKRMP